VSGSPVDTVFRGAGTLMCRGPEGNRLVILHYHRVPSVPDPMCPDLLPAPVFDLHMRALAENFRVVPLAEGLADLREGRLPARAVSVTFDDGYADNCQVALPILRRHGLVATFFVAAGFLDGGCMFNDLVIEACRVAPPGTWNTGVDATGTVQVPDSTGRVALASALIGQLKYLEGEERYQAALQLLNSVGGPYPDGIMMRSDEVRTLHRSGMSIGGHTLHHPILARLSAADADREIREGKRALESLLGARVPLFAYPNGKPGADYLPRDVSLARDAGFEGALTTVWASATRQSPGYEIPRVGSWDRTRLRFSARLLRCYRTPLAVAAEPRG